MIRFLFTLVVVGVLVFCAATVKLGNRTFFGHVRAIWATDEAKDLKKGVKDTAGPAVHRLERGVEAGVKAMKNDGSGSAAAQHHR